MAGMGELLLLHAFIQSKVESIHTHVTPNTPAATVHATCTISLKTQIPSSPVYSQFTLGQTTRTKNHPLHDSYQLNTIAQCWSRAQTKFFNHVTTHQQK
jgi:hypothetical protein